MFVAGIAAVVLLLFVAAGVEADARGAVVVVSFIAFEDGVSPRGKDGRWTWTMDVGDGCGRWTRQWRANTKATRAVAIADFCFLDPTASLHHHHQ